MQDFPKPRFHNSSALVIFPFVDIFHDFLHIVFILFNVNLNSNWFNGSYLYHLWFYIISFSYLYRFE